MEEIKMYKTQDGFFKKHSILSFIIFACALPIVTLVLLVFLTKIPWNIRAGTNDGWLGFWGGYLGAIIAIVGVYWSVTEQLKSDKEGSYRIERPFFILSFKDSLDYSSETYISDAVSASECEYNILNINNVSSKDMYAVKIFVENSDVKDFKQYFKYKVKYNHDKLEIKFINSNEKNVELDNNLDKLRLAYKNSISINKISAGQKVNLVFSKDVAINQVWIWYITEIRESIKVYYHTNGDKQAELEYSFDDRVLENQLKSKNKNHYSANYTLQDFRQSKSKQKIN